MICQKCGNEILDNIKFCPHCGNSCSIHEEVVYGNDFNPNGAYVPYTGKRLKDNRGLFSYIVLSIITCGIYGLWFVYKMAYDVNIACEGDGNNTPGLGAFIILSIITCGIYSFIWQYKLGNRLSANANRYGMFFQENGTTILLWKIFGALLCGIGPFVAMHILIKNSNKICNAYNCFNGM